ncbi:MAG: hypothetical protein HYZ43_01440 [Flavobacteriia bacterium]|nr:hypothetical protein [Flavobacteriia bacterium]
MKYLFAVALLLLLVTFGCSNEPRVVTEGKIIYAIDYPDCKDNFFLYSILPKEMEVNFKGGKMQSVIKKANLINELLVDCNDKSFAAYFKYGDEAFNVTLLETDVKSMLGDQQKYTIKMTSIKDTMAGFNVKKAIATSVSDPSDKIDLWYTDEIQVKNSNWYNPFKEIDGFLLAYSIDRYGIRMEFKAKGYEEIEITDEQLAPRKDGVPIPYGDYNKKLDGLFQSFE